jgi:hypothetical protein
MVMNTLKSGLYSHNSDVTTWCCKLLAKLGLEFRDVEQDDEAWSWYITDEKEGGLGVCLHSLKRHYENLEAVISVVMTFGRGRLDVS